jgi:predicted nucleic acid-binding protein
MIVVSDSSPLISFALLNKLTILDQLFDEIYIPFAVHNEICQQSKPYAKELKKISINRVKKVRNQLAVQLLQKDLDLGEAEAIVLAKETNISDILIDEHKGRRIAKAHGLSPIGTIGVIIQAKREGIIRTIKPELDTLIANHLRISKSLYNRALELAGEK